MVPSPPASLTAATSGASADERYELFLDGQRIGRGPERGAPDTWFYESFVLDLNAGEHVLAARAWALGDLAPDAQMSAAPGFLLAAEGEWNARLSTGVAAWEAKLVDGIDYHRQTGSQLRGSRFIVDGSLYPWGHECGSGEGWKPAIPLKRAMGAWINWDFYKDHRLQPATLPEMHEAPLPAGKVRHVQNLIDGMDERRNAPVLGGQNLAPENAEWQALLEGRGAVKVPAGRARRVIVELADYSIAYPELVISGGRGGLVEVQWAEALKLTPDVWDPHKGDRDDIEGKFFAGLGDRFLPDGGEKRCFEPLWWMAGRYVEIYVQAGAEPISIEGIKFTERRYSLDMDSQFSCSDTRLTEIIPIMLRGMQMCSNETFFDCPYYEELMYTGDTRLECLVTYSMMNDDRLPRKALRMFDVSRLASGMTQSRYPCRSTQVISTFALWWIGLAHDYVFWRNDAGYIRDLLPGMRSTIQGFRHLIGEDGLLRGAEGWNTIDWVPEWSEDAGVPPEGHSGVSGLLNWQYIYALRLYEDLERRLGDAEQAAWAERFGREMADKAAAAFWNPERGLLADNLAQSRYSEHTQIMALLSGQLDSTLADQVKVNLFTDAHLDRATIYFSHYYFEVCRLLERMDKFFERMGLWFYLKQMGFKTPVEIA